MKILYFPTPKEAASEIQSRLHKAALTKKKPLRVFLPTGRTPDKIYECLIAEKEFWKSHLIPIQIDEFIDPAGIFFNELKDKILNVLELESKTIRIDPRWTDQAMALHVEKSLEPAPDFAVLGLGPNGHVGFHEPGLRASFMGGRVGISDSSRNRVPGAGTDQVFTFGVGSFLKAEEIFLAVFGEEKRMILEEVIKTPPTEKIPATLLKAHVHLTIFTDINF